MAKLKVKKGLEANLPAVEDGSLLITTDSKKLYLDNGEERIQVGGNSGGSAGADASIYTADGIVKSDGVKFKSSAGSDAYLTLTDGNKNAVLTAKVPTTYTNTALAKVTLGAEINPTADFGIKTQKLVWDSAGYSSAYPSLYPLLEYGSEATLGAQGKQPWTHAYINNLNNINTISWATDSSSTFSELKIGANPGRPSVIIDSQRVTLKSPNTITGMSGQQESEILADTSLGATPSGTDFAASRLKLTVRQSGGPVGSGTSKDHSLIFGFTDAITCKFYTDSAGVSLGSSENPWSNVYSSGLSLGSLTGTGTTSGGSYTRDLSVNASDSVTFGNGKYGTVNNRISLLTSKVVKSSASGSPTTYNGKFYIYSNGTDSGDSVVLELQDSGKSNSSANSNNSLVLKSVGDSKSSTSYQGNGMIQFQCTNYSGSSSFTNTVTIGGYMDMIQMFPMSTLSYLGTSFAPWGNLFATGTHTNYIENTSGIGSNYAITVYNNLIPNANSTSASTGYTLGDSSHKWRYLYAYSGSIQTSDRSAKDSIHYIQYVEDSEAMKPATMSMRSTAVENTSEGTASQITLEDVIDFVSNLSPVTFCYKDGQGEDVEATEENSDPEDIQLGLIADDIKDHKLFKYVGVETTYEEEVTPAVKDEEGNVVTEAVTETKTTLGLQAIPLATAALTACKYLIQKNEEIESRLSAIEEQLAALLSTDGN